MSKITVHTQTRSIEKRSDDSDIYDFVISTPDKDRHGTVIKSDAWKLDNYNRNGIVCYQHKHSDYGANPDFVIGTSTVTVGENALSAAMQFEPGDINPLKVKVKHKIDHNILRATSVGFLPISGHWGNAERGEDESLYYFDQVELYEWSIVNVGSNPNALIQKSADLESYLDLERKKNPTRANRSIQYYYIRAARLGIKRSS